MQAGPSHGLDVPVAKATWAPPLPAIPNPLPVSSAGRTA
jgi:hypothetical protein